MTQSKLTDATCLFVSTRDGKTSNAQCLGIPATRKYQDLANNSSTYHRKGPESQGAREPEIREARDQRARVTDQRSQEEKEPEKTSHPNGIHHDVHSTTAEDRLMTLLANAALI